MTNGNKISDYALIGNSRSAALVSKYGGIDWCCLPEFHSPAIFSALLDSHKGGHFSIAPTEEYISEQHYLPYTNVLETVFTTKHGKARILDAFVASTEEEKTYALFPDHEVLRIVETTQGFVHFKMEYEPRIYFGKRAAALTDNQKLGIEFSWKENTCVLLTTIENIKVADNKVSAEFEVKANEWAAFSMSYSNQNPAIIPELKTTAWDRMNRTINYWRDWILQCRYKGPYEQQVKRSVLALKLLFHAPSGAIIAAPTTSLPEEIGGVRNWDYRYCWLRDASFTLRVLAKLGFDQEANAYMSWILHATQLTRPGLQILYSVFGDTHLSEKKLDWLEGYQKSMPVRIGNGAHRQLQLDVYGEVLDAAFSYSKLIDKFPRDSRKFITGLGEVICKLWNRPDHGIWEVRASPAHYTHSKVMAWVGLDRLIKLAKKYSWEEVPITKYEEIKTHIESKIENLGYSAQLNSYTGEFNGNSLDASSLVFPLVGYCEASSPNMLSTIKAIREHLVKNRFLYRYLDKADGLKGLEGSFGICNFWMVENLAKSGKTSEATEVFEMMLDHASPTGLFSEEIDPETHELLGNYPQGFTHIGLINAAFSLEEAARRGGRMQCL